MVDIGRVIAGCQHHADAPKHAGEAIQIDIQIVNRVSGEQERTEHATEAQNAQPQRMSWCTEQHAAMCPRLL